MRLLPTLIWTFSLLISNISFACLEYSSQWQSCEKDSNCAIFQGACGEDRALNKAFSEKIKKCFSQDARISECTQIKESRKNSSAVCVQKQCKVTYPPAL